jgi:hypothetical protein
LCANSLLDDPANNNRSCFQLLIDARRYQQQNYIVPRLTAEALKTFPLSDADDPGFLYLEPLGLARQMFALHQLEIRQRGAGVIGMTPSVSVLLYVPYRVRNQIVRRFPKQGIDAGGVYGRVLQHTSRQDVVRHQYADA